MDERCVSTEGRGCDSQAGVPIAERVAYSINRWGRAHVEGVIVVVCLVVGDEGCEVVVVVYVEDCDRVM